jgi:hypothetical protein
MRPSLRNVTPFALAAVLALAACGGDNSGSGSGSGAASGSGSGAASGSGSGEASGEPKCTPVGDLKTASSELDIQLAEWSITGASTAKTGKLGIVAKNIGQKAHEFVVAQVNSVSVLEAAKAADGSVDEAKLPKDAVIGEVEGFPAGETCSGVFDLEPGDYVLFCNIVEKLADGTVESHFAKGMYSDLTVTS